jgi:hypothetical protein
MPARVTDRGRIQIGTQIEEVTFDQLDFVRRIMVHRTKVIGLAQRPALRCQNAVQNAIEAGKHDRTLVGCQLPREGAQHAPARSVSGEGRGRVQEGGDVGPAQRGRGLAHCDDLSVVVAFSARNGQDIGVMAEGVSFRTQVAEQAKLQERKEVLSGLVCPQNHGDHPADRADPLEFLIRVPVAEERDGDRMIEGSRPIAIAALCGYVGFGQAHNSSPLARQRLRWALLSAIQ